jgi:hypothetical protein
MFEYFVDFNETPKSLSPNLPIRDSQLVNVIKLIKPVLINNILYYDGMANVFKLLLTELKKIKYHK